MKKNILPAIRITLVSVFVLLVAYPLLILGVAQLAPAKGEGEKITVNNRTVGYKLEGQRFSEDKYFWSRPSAVAYNAAGSAGSNKGPSNPDHLAEVKMRVDTFLAHNPSVAKEQVPSELVTASGSGLDPDLSPAAAMVQVKRIAEIRGIKEDKIIALIDQYIRNPVMGTQTVNVLELNLALDGLR